MKKTALIILAAAFCFTACKKNEEKTDNGHLLSSLQQSLADYTIPENTNEEARRQINDIQDPKYTIAIIDNPNFGKFSATPENDISISGKSLSDVGLTLNNVPYHADRNGQWYKQGSVFKNYYGRNVAVNLSDSRGNTFTANMYVPRPILADQLSPAGRQEIQRTGNRLSWTRDPNNRANKVALYYVLYDNQNLGDEGGVIKTDILLLDDGVPFNMDNILSNASCKRIYFRLITGNTASTTFNNEKVLFHISSYDHHEYLVN